MVDLRTRRPIGPLPRRTDTCTGSHERVTAAVLLHRIPAEFRRHHWPVPLREDGRSSSTLSLARVTPPEALHGCLQDVAVSEATTFDEVGIRSILSMPLHNVVKSVNTRDDAGKTVWPVSVYCGATSRRGVLQRCEASCTGWWGRPTRQHYGCQLDRHGLWTANYKRLRHGLRWQSHPSAGGSAGDRATTVRPLGGSRDGQGS